jgi:hypothetical protein
LDQVAGSSRWQAAAELFTRRARWSASDVANFAEALKFR